jgi:hypothetical protein
VQKRIMGMNFKEVGPLDEIADITGALTYGEMIDLAAELWKAAGGAEITAETFPAIFHRWSRGRAHRPETPAPADTALMPVEPTSVDWADKRTELTE